MTKHTPGPCVACTGQGTDGDGVPCMRCRPAERRKYRQAQMREHMRAKGHKSVRHDGDWIVGALIYNIRCHYGGDK